ncbi:hypothetical protein C8F01DRAFT_999416 [Mycena amicta]|nr:hypothetical protein C8F01DRAFT_999416 [Mycena amicta]
MTVLLGAGTAALATVLVYLYWTTGGSEWLRLSPSAHEAARHPLATAATKGDPEYASLEHHSSGESSEWYSDETLDSDAGAISESPLHPQTTIPNNAQVHGFTVIDNLYLRNGTFYMVAPNASSVFPPRRQLLSLPVDLSVANTDPTDRELQFLEPEDAVSVLGDARAMRIVGTSVVVYDVAQFMTHYYHWFGEIILGFWRIYSHLLVDGASPDAVPVVDFSRLPPVQRFLLPLISTDVAWRDKAGIDGPIMRGAFPGASIETEAYWKDLKTLGTSVVFDRVVLVNRAAAHKHPFGSVWYKMIAGSMNVSVPEDFWRPIRENLWESFWGDRFSVASLRTRPLVTYISRQGGGRRLVQADHEVLVASLYELEAEGICDVQVVRMEQMTLKEQVDLVRNSTILLGVHGNGLTNQLWMQPSPRSTVIEILVPGGYTFDYEMLARNMGHKHYAVWNDTYLTYEKGTYHKASLKGVKFPEGFHGTSIPVYGPTVAQIIKSRLA